MAEIPQSPALSEATLESLQDVLSRSPETWSEADTLRGIEAMREWRARVLAAEAAGKTKLPRAPKLTGPQLAPKGTTPGDLGI